MFVTKKKKQQQWNPVEPYVPAGCLHVYQEELLILQDASTLHLLKPAPALATALRHKQMQMTKVGQLKIQTFHDSGIKPNSVSFLQPQFIFFIVTEVKPALARVSEMYCV